MVDSVADPIGWLQQRYVDKARHRYEPRWRSAGSRRGRWRQS
jgi:hypothetical protein